jgi:hypothetical protein
MEAVYAGVRRELHPDDISGISTLYPAESMPTGDSPVVSITGPADGSTLESGATIAFAGAASDTEDGDLSANLVWVSSIDGTIGTGGSFATELSDGTHVITATVTDADGNTTEQSISITIGDVDVATTVSIVSVTYSTEGGRNNNRNLSVTLTLADNLGQPVSAATVGVVIYFNGDPTWQAVGTTGSDGRVTFTVKNAPNGTYYTGVYQIAGTSLSWDGETPFNNYEKSSVLGGGRHGQHRALAKQARPGID